MEIKDIIKIREEIVGIALEALNMNAKYFGDEPYKREDLFKYKFCLMDFNTMSIRLPHFRGLFMSGCGELSAEGRSFAKKYRENYDIYTQDEDLYIWHKLFNTSDAKEVRNY